MPAYFFHIAFELYQQSSPSIVDQQSGQTARSPSFIPPQNYNIFAADHLLSPGGGLWTNILAPRRKSTTIKRNTHRAGHGKENKLWNTRRGTSLGTSRIASAPASEVSKASQDKAHPSSREGKVATRPEERTDWRFSEISIDSIDMESREPISRVETRPKQRPQAPGATQPLTATYTPTNPQTTEFGWGVVHLYRDELENGHAREDKSSNEQIDEDAAFLDEDCTTLCILAVPSYMTHSDLLGWVGEETRDQVSHFRLVRTDRSNRFMVLLKFRDSVDAKKWQKEWNGKLFNSMEPENAHVVFIKSISFQTTEANNDPESFPDMSNDPFTPAIARTFSTLDQAQGTSADPFTTPGIVELPSCPVCLERMDDTSGLATIFCQHVFHCACLQKWRGSGCPVCRYTQEDPLYKSRSNNSDEAACSTCGITSNLWICLICGNIGCGRYDSAHARSHYSSTGHTFSMDLSDEHIWDYDGDNYVHKLLQDKSNGKLMELPSASSHHPHDHDPSDLPWEKAQKMSYEYTTLITSQLDSQRLYFEEQIERAVDKASKAAAAEAVATESSAHATSRMLELESSHSTLLNETLPAMERVKTRAEKRAEKADALFREMRKDAQEKEAMNESLLVRVRLLQGQVEELMKGKSEVEETNRDLMGYISCIEKLKDAGEEVREGTVVVAEAPAAGKKKKRGGKK